MALPGKPHRAPWTAGEFLHWGAPGARDHPHCCAQAHSQDIQNWWWDPSQTWLQHLLQSQILWDSLGLVIRSQRLKGDFYVIHWAEGMNRFPSLESVIIYLAPLQLYLSLRWHRNNVQKCSNRIHSPLVNLLWPCFYPCLSCRACTEN